MCPRCASACLTAPWRCPSRPAAGGRLFEPQITPTAAGRRHAKWKKAVERSFALADLTRDLEEDSEPRQEEGQPTAEAGGKGAAPEPEGPRVEGPL